MSTETLYIVIWAVMILPIAVVFKRYLTPKEATTEIVAGAFIWPALTVLGIFALAVFIGLVLPCAALGRVTDYLVERIK